MQERAAWFQNFSVQFSQVAASLGFLPAVVTAVAADNDDVQFVASATVEIDAYAAAFRQYRNILLEGNVGEPTPNFPPNPTIGPSAQVATGIFERLDELVKRIRVAPAYTNDVGALLGILPPVVNGFLPDEMQPKLKAVAMPGSVVQVSFVRGQTDGVLVETKLDNIETWTDAGRFFKSPAELVIPQNPANLPRAVQVRARYVNGDKPVGQFSTIVSTSTQPGS